MPEGKRRNRLIELCQIVFNEGLHGKVLPFDEAAAHHFARLRSGKQRRGLSMEALDAQIAAIALTTGAAIATRNTADFEDCGLTLINPWLP